MTRKKINWKAALGLTVLTTIGAVFYRLGGYGHGFNTKVRDLGIPLCALIWFYWSGVFILAVLPCLVMMFAAQTTYFKKKGTDAKWYNWLFVGLAFSISYLPYSLVVGNVSGFMVRTVIVTVFTVLWSEFVGKDTWEEMGRGAIQIVTLPLLT